MIACMKNRRIGRVILFILTITAACFLYTFNVRAASNIVIGGVDIGYAVGDYFTKDGKSCATTAFSDGTCHGHGICIENTDSRCNCLRYWPSKANCQVDLAATQCFGFARFCQWKLFGCHDGNAASSFEDISGKITASNCTADTLKSKLLGCAPATHIRTGDNGHSIVVVKTDSGAIQTVACNTKVDGVKVCKIYSKSYTWSEFADYLNGRGGILYAKANKCSHTYDSKGICSECGYQFPYDNDRDTAYAGTYKVVKGATAYIRKGPYQKCTEVTRATTGSFVVKARVLNCKGNYWYELEYNGSTCYCVAGNLEPVHTHVFEIGYETAHPHKQYRKCSCGYTEYTGATKLVSGCATCYPQATYGSTNPDDYVYPERSLTYTSPTMKGKDVAWVQAVLYQLGYSIDVDGSYGKNSVATVKQFQTNHGLEVDGHCGPATRAKLLELWNAKKHTHYYSSYADAAHPHNEYIACSCGDKQYTGSNYTSWESTGYEETHPHEVFRTCWCGYREYTGECQTVDTCAECTPVGDFTGDMAVTNDDVVYLLWHTLFPEEYPLSAAADFTKDGAVNNDDVVFLLWHTLFPEDYQI